VSHLNHPDHEALHHIIHHDITVHTACAYTSGLTNLNAVSYLIRVQT
jgi:hypothetical protein